jgi:Bacterial capsule synthesis protein PGA_cap
VATRPTADATPTASAQTKPQVTPRTFTIVGSGDILLHPQLWDQARKDSQANGRPGYDFRPLFADVRDVISSADFAICHLETPLAPPDGPFSGFPSFSVPPHVVAALADVGYDTCSTASNHTIDKGEPGVARTLRTLDEAGIRHAGSARSAAERATVTIVDRGDIAVAHLSYTFSFNGLRRPADKPWLANLIDREEILGEARRARTLGADVVVVSLHFGTEYSHVPNAQQLSLSRQLLASSDVDLILGHHAHVVQPLERLGEDWVAYGLGNQVARHARPTNDNREGVLSRFTFAELSPGGRWQVSKAEAIPVWMDLAPENRLLNLAKAVADPARTPGERSALRAALDRIRRHVLARGATDDGLVVLGA